MELTKQELNNVIGGAISGAVITSIGRAVNIIFELGRGFGSSLRRIVSKRFC